MSEIFTTKENPLVSIIIPIYNAEKLIEETIDSVLKQTYQNWEIIAVDDCSTDNTVSLLQKLSQKDKRIKLVQLKKNFGAPAHPRNVGVQKAQGKWVAYLDSDDIWHPQKLEHQIKACQLYNILFCSTAMKDFKDSSLLRPRKFFFDESKILKTSFFSQKIKSTIPTSSVLLHRDLALAFSFNESPAFKAVEDYDSWLAIHQKIKHGIKLMQPYVYYRISENQISKSKLKQIQKVFRVHRKYDGKNIFKTFFYMLTYAIFSIYYRYLKHGL